MIEPFPCEKSNLSLKAGETCSTAIFVATNY